MSDINTTQNNDKTPDATGDTTTGEVEFIYRDPTTGDRCFTHDVFTLEDPSDLPEHHQHHEFGLLSIDEKKTVWDPKVGDYRLTFYPQLPLPKSQQPFTVGPVIDQETGHPKLDDDGNVKKRKRYTETITVLASHVAPADDPGFYGQGTRRAADRFGRKVYRGRKGTANDPTAKREQKATQAAKRAAEAEERAGMSKNGDYTLLVEALKDEQGRITALGVVEVGGIEEPLKRFVPTPEGRKAAMAWAKSDEAAEALAERHPDPEEGEGGTEADDN
jgi:hypothetical protein